MMMSGKDFLNSHVLSCRQKVYSDLEDLKSSGRAFQPSGGSASQAVKCCQPGFPGCRSTNLERSTGRCDVC